jgi:hypothetical protein
MYTTQVRNGAQISYIDNTPYYDFDYQNYNFLQTPVTLQSVCFTIQEIIFFLLLFLIKGDTIYTSCTYSTSSVTSYVFVIFYCYF